MNRSKTPAPLNKQIYEEACEWLIAFRTGPVGPDSKIELDAWLRRSPEHVRAYLELNAIWEDTALHDPNRLTSSEAHIARARSMPDDKVISMPSRREELPVTGSPGKRARLAIALAASLLLAAVGIGFGLLQRGVYVTEIGEQRSVTLRDGSVIDLNARSRIRVRYTSGTRRIDLIEGQALFRVAQDHARPFIVDSGSTHVRAVGTQFDVNRKSAGLIVTVVEGRVAVVAPVARSEAGTPVAAGEQLIVTDTSARKTEHPDISAATAWTQLRLVFNSAALSDVVEEFNRYNARQLVIDTPELQSLGVVGVFSSTDPGALLRFLNVQPGVRVEERGDQIHILSTAR